MTASNPLPCPFCGVVPAPLLRVAGEGIQATEKATLSFPSNDMAQDFAKRWSRKTLTGHDMTAIRPDGSRDVTVYGVTEEHKAFISAYIETITNL
jgi:hypothetical protein